MPRLRSLLALAALALPLAGCGSDADGPSPDEAFAADAYRTDGFAAPREEGFQPASAGPAAARGGAFTDPVEGAFRIPVPEGWKAEGGGRRDQADYATWYRLRSADGAEIFMGDPRQSFQFSLPGAYARQQGLREGQTFLGKPIRRLVPAAAFAAEYAARYARGHGCQDFRVTRQLSEAETMQRTTPTQRQRADRERQKAVRNLQAMATEPPQIQFPLGGVEFACRGREGTLYMAGISFTTGPVGMWAMAPAGFIGPEGSRARLQALADRVGDGFQKNPRWEQAQDQRIAEVVQRQQQENRQTAQRVAQINARTAQINAQGAMDRSRITAQTYSDISDIQMQGWQSRNRSSDEMQRRSVNAIHGTADVYNPTTGDTQWGVQGGAYADSWWGDGAGNVVGVEGYDNPDASQYDGAYNLDDAYDQGYTGDDW